MVNNNVLGQDFDIFLTILSLPRAVFFTMSRESSEMVDFCNFDVFVDVPGTIRNLSKLSFGDFFDNFGVSINKEGLSLRIFSLDKN